MGGLEIPVAVLFLIGADVKEIQFQHELEQLKEELRRYRCEVSVCIVVEEFRLDFG